MLQMLYLSLSMAAFRNLGNSISPLPVLATASVQYLSMIPLRATCRAYSTVANAHASADFLQGAPHRKHPGVTALKTVHLPEELLRGALSIIHGAARRDLMEQAHRLTNFLWSRKRPLDETKLRERALALEKALWEEEMERGGDRDSHVVEMRIRKKVLSTLRRTTYHWTTLKYDNELSVVYLAARLAGGYAALRRALNEIKKRDTTFSPFSLLDFGSGLGTSVWAVHATWGESVKESVCVDSSKAMNTLAEQLLRGGNDKEEPLIKHVYFRQFLPVSPKVQFDLVISAFALSELTSKQERLETVLTLWRKTHSYMVLVENGTKEGHQILMEARDTVLTGEDKILDCRYPTVFAPCAHQSSCPKLARESQEPCNYPQPYSPLPLPGTPRQEVELFSYLVIARQAPTDENRGSEWARLTGPVLRRPRHVHCQLCCPDGELKRVVITASRHGRDVYRCARNSTYGDRLPFVKPEVENVAD